MNPAHSPAAQQIDPSIATLTVFEFPSAERMWALTQMAFARPLLRGIPGMRFRKLMGTGRGSGFTLAPDWSRYALLAAWDSQQHASGFLFESRFMRCYRRHACAEATVMLRTLSSHGTWDDRTPFLPSGEGTPAQSAVLGVLTRASIKPSRLAAFWRRVAPVSNVLERAPGLRVSIGTGELPFIRQATFSIWESQDAMMEFAYHSAEHREVIARTRREGWYSEEMFTRFEVISTITDSPPAGLEALTQLWNSGNQTIKNRENPF